MSGIIPAALEAITEGLSLVGIKSPSDALVKFQQVLDAIPLNPRGLDVSQDREKVGDEFQKQRQLFADITAENDALVAMRSYLQLAKSVATPVT